MGGSGAKTVELYHLQDEIWRSVSDLHVTRINASSCINGGYVYIFGGNTSIEPTNEIERLNFFDQQL